MELFIQMGHNTRKLAMEHLKDFGSGTVILSPMNIAPNKIKDCSAEVHRKNGTVLVDPQLHYPRKIQKNYLSMRFGHKMILLHWNPDTLTR